MALTDKLTAIADAIRGKTGGTDALTLEAMAKAITALETGGVSFQVSDVTFDSNSYTYTIPNELGKDASFFAVFLNGTSAPAAYQCIAYAIFLTSEGCYYFTIHQDVGTAISYQRRAFVFTEGQTVLPANNEGETITGKRLYPCVYEVDGGYKFQNYATGTYTGASRFSSGSTYTFVIGG